MNPRWLPKFPASVPDYRWPADLRANGTRALRLALDAVFYVCYVVGWIASLFDRTPERVLVIRTDGMGDALLFEPALDNLSRTFIAHEIHLWAPQLSCELFRYFAAIDRMVEVPRGFKSGNLLYFKSFPWRARLGWTLGRWQFDLVIYPAESPEPLGNWLFTSARARQRWLNAGDTLHQFESQRLNAHAFADRILPCSRFDTHELERNQQLAHAWNAEVNLRSPRVHVPQLVRQRAAAQIETWRQIAIERGGSRIAGVIPGASMSINSYPIDRWMVILGRLWTEQQTVPVLLGGPSDQDLLRDLGKRLKNLKIPHITLSRTVTLIEMCALVGQLDGVVSVDTGLAHVAVAQEVPTAIILAGGNPNRFFPWPDAPHHAAVSLPLPCTGCNNRCHFAEAVCITQLDPHEVVEAYQRVRTRRVALPLAA